jgi:hypothetical protein
MDISRRSLVGMLAALFVSSDAVLSSTALAAEDNKPMELYLGGQCITIEDQELLAKRIYKCFTEREYSRDRLPSKGMTFVINECSFSVSDIVHNLETDKIVVKIKINDVDHYSRVWSEDHDGKDFYQHLKEEKDRWDKRYKNVITV